MLLPNYYSIIRNKNKKENLPSFIYPGKQREFKLKQYKGGFKNERKPQSRKKGFKWEKFYTH